MANETIFTVTIFAASRSEPLILENNSITSFTFIEDIYNSLPLAILQFTDRGGLVEALPLIGRELVSIIYGPDVATASTTEDTGTRTQNFIAYDIDFKSEIGNTGSGVTTVTMKLVDPLYITMNFSRYSKSWLNKTGSDIIKDICTNMIGGGYELAFDKFEDSEDNIGTVVNDTNGDKSFIMPYWTPTETIRWLIKRMKGSNSPGYLFYCSTKGFNLVTLSTLFDSSKNTVDPKKYFFNATDQDMYFDENRILNWKMYPPSNSALSYLPGGTAMSPRFDTKDMRENSNLGSLEYKKYTWSGSEPLYHPDINNATSNVLTVGGDYVMIDNNFRDGWIKRYMRQLQMEILAKGHVKRFAGMLIDLEWPAMQTAMQNTNYNGRYLIKSIQHIFNPGAQPAYKQMMRVAKTSYKDTTAGGALGT
jgi:hypothetical protein